MLPDNLAATISFAFPMFLGLLYMWASLMMPDLVRMLRHLVSRKDTP
jgi:hypothetical protein